jgi:hypothetical protein
VRRRILSTTGQQYNGESIPKTYDDPAKYTTWMEQKTKEGSSVNPVSFMYDKGSDNLPSSSMLLTWGKIILSWDTLGYESSIWKLIGKKEDSSAKESN